MHTLHIDIETYSSIDIKNSGLYKYAQADDFSILLLAYSFDGEDPRVVDPKDPNDEMQMYCLKNRLFDPNILKYAYNAAFEWYCLSRYFELTDEYAAGWLSQWRCTMLHGMYCGYTAGLGATCTAMGLPQDKSKLSTGTALIRTFCCPCKPTRTNGQRTRTLPQHEPEKWELFKQYCAQDVAAEMEIEHRLASFPVPDDVQRQWELDQRINLRGVAVDLPLIDGALWVSEAVTAALTDEAVSLSGLSNPNSLKQLTEWMQKELGEDVSNLRKDTVKGLLLGDLESDTARRMLEIRKELGKTSVSKYTAMQSCVCDDGRIRGLLQFYGANRTGRWAGRLVQVQNLPQTHVEPLGLARELVRDKKTDALQLIYGSPMSVLSQLVRTAFVPARGGLFIDADFSAIEARVIAWLADEAWVLDVFSTHGKIYEACAAQMFGVDIDKIVKGQPEYALRAKGKVATLALGYQGAANALIAMGALNMGIAEDELPEIVNRWRLANKNIVALWSKVEAAALEAVRTGRPVVVQGITFALEGDYATDQAFMNIELPSGRKLYYAKPFISANRWGADSLHYFGMNQTTKRWETTDTYGGKLVENIVQAIARDCLAVTVEQLEADGYPVVFHVHDEVVVEASQLQNPDAVLQNVLSIMSQPLSWAPGLPLAADGWIGQYYTKD